MASLTEYAKKTFLERFPGIQWETLKKAGVEDRYVEIALSPWARAVSAKYESIALPDSASVEAAEAAIRGSASALRGSFPAISAAVDAGLLSFARPIVLPRDEFGLFLRSTWYSTSRVTRLYELDALGQPYGLAVGVGDSETEIRETADLCYRTWQFLDYVEPMVRRTYGTKGETRVGLAPAAGVGIAFLIVLTVLAIIYLIGHLNLLFAASKRADDVCRGVAEPGISPEVARERAKLCQDLGQQVRTSSSLGNALIPPDLLKSTGQAVENLSQWVGVAVVAAAGVAAFFYIPKALK